MKDLTSMIILTWNALDYTKMCLDSLNDYTPENHEIIVVDNGSHDGTVAFLKEQPHLHCIYNKKNRGFAGGVNQGLRKARGRYILLLNNDTILTRYWLRNLLACLASGSQVGLVGPRSNLVGGEQGKMGKLPFTNLEDMQIFARTFNEKSNPKAWFPLESLSGFCLLMKREVYEAVGSLDERFQLGTREDRDYCIRARKKGFQLLCAGDTFVYHFGHRTFQSNRINPTAIHRENMEKFVEKWGHR